MEIMRQTKLSNITNLFTVPYRKLVRKGIIKALTVLFLILIFSFFFLVKQNFLFTTSMEREEEIEKCIDFINMSMDLCLKHKDRSDQNKEFSRITTKLPLRPVKMTQTTAVFLYTGNGSQTIMKRVIVKHDSPSVEDIIATKLKHPNIMETTKSFRRDYITDREEHQELIWLFSEYLKQKISQRFVNRDENIIRKIVKDILTAYIFIHKQHIVHLDMKIANVMGQMDSNGNIIYKLIDFGYARDLSKEENPEEIKIPNKSYGTFPYKPPETVFENIHGVKGDIWCLGCVAWFLSLGKTPFYLEDGEKNIESYKRFLRGKIKHFFREETSLELRDFIIKCMKRDRELRPTAEELMNHPFITGETTIKYDSDVYSDDSGYESDSIST
ncbi:MAP kinase kinase kinase wis4 [Astathelohania contejeani]|uniref:MAP kinase kinase kinase wis4 n=1 Tax=Astathelohania contejeani TaxID=164912 RepID=A0ABQ7I215_9MICR|nr:MAP kinase kinase kinase wis4 [Thelohania contejeani]